MFIDRKKGFKVTTVVNLRNQLRNLQKVEHKAKIFRRIPSPITRKNGIISSWGYKSRSVIMGNIFEPNNVLVYSKLAKLQQNFCLK